VGANAVEPQGVQPRGVRGDLNYAIPAGSNREETDGYWNAIIGNGGTDSQCGWCKDRWGRSWQITPRALTDALAAGGGKAKRAFDAMMTMKKIDITAIEAARRG
jgi:predicted 3-demethylubiquinone-9 3-methyltransferase (glyoxalase superfamily)